MLDDKGFDKWAGSYDDGMTADSDTFPFIGYYDLLARTCELVDPRPGLTVIDVGIGTGLLSEELSRRGCTIYGVDFAEQMLSKARSRVPGGTFDRVEVARDHLGQFNSRRFDRVVSTYFLHHLTRQQQISFIDRAVRENLRPNGKIVIADIGFENEHDFARARDQYYSVWDEDEFYLCGEVIVATLTSRGIKADYEQVTPCGGLLWCSD